MSKTYRRGPDKVRVLADLDLAVESGEFVTVVGASGSGKSTLLHMLGTLDTPDAGTVTLDGKRVDTARGRARDELRNKTFGYIFQFYHLLPEFNTLENVLTPAYIAHTPWGWLKARKKWRRRADELLERVGLAHRVKHKPRELSGGEMQRAAVARALLSDPRVLFADEPTGNLDAETGAGILKLLLDLNREQGVTVLMVTHNLEIAALTDRVVRMAHGRLVPAEETYPQLAAV